MGIDGYLVFCPFYHGLSVIVYHPLPVVVFPLWYQFAHITCLYGIYIQ